MAIDLQFNAPEPFDRAVERLAARTPVASLLRTDDWGVVGLGVRDRAFWSAGVDDANLVGDMRGRIGRALSMDPAEAFESRSKFVAEMRQAMGAAPGDPGAMTDIASRRRLELIYDTNVEEAYEFGRYQAGQSAALLEAFPARELVRVEERQERRDWYARWINAGGPTPHGRLVARRDDPVWVKISRFGRPYPPFDFGSGMGVIDIERDEAIDLGVIAPGEIPEAAPKVYNQELEASARGYWKDTSARQMLEDAFGEQIAFEHGRAVWAGNRLTQMLDTALREGAGARGAFQFGKPSAKVRSMLNPDTAAMVGDRRMSVTPSNLYHAMDRHGPRDLVRPGSGERRAGQIPLSRADIEHLNQVWMAPDDVGSDRDGLVLRRRTLGGVLEIVLTPAGGTLRPVSIRKKEIVP